MDVSHVRDRVTAIAEAADDFEHAHGLEDDLFSDVLASIAMTSTDAQAKALAAAALRSKEIHFQRVTA